MAPRRQRHVFRSIGVAFTRMPILADHRGLRWLLNGRVMPGGPIVIITHRGRRTGKTYRTPVEALVDDTDIGEIVVCPAHGERADWYRNMTAGGLVDVRLRGHSHRGGWRRLSQDEAGDVLDRYRRRHPRWSRLILRGLARSNHLSGEALPAVAQSLPIVALRSGDPRSGQ